MNESNKPVPQNFKVKLGFPDITAEEHYYSRSIKIRLGVLDCLSRLAKKGNTSHPATWESFEDLGAYCANFIFDFHWDRRPASSVTAARWCKQFFYSNGLFKALPLGSGLFSVEFRHPAAASRIIGLLREYRRKQKHLKAEVEVIKALDKELESFPPKKEI